MADHGHGEPRQEGGLRRRRSTHTEDGELMIEPVEYIEDNDRQVPRRTLSEPIQYMGTFTADGHNTPRIPDESSRSNGPRVRFSTDIERAAPLSSTNTQPGGISSILSTQEDVPAMLVTSPTAMTPEEDEIRRDTEMRLAVVPLNPSLPQRSATAPSTSRNRGYSLRRSLFARSMLSQSQSEGDNLPIELVPSASSRTQAETPGRREQPGHKRTPESSVTVSAIIKEDDTGLNPEPLKPGEFFSSLPNYQMWVQRKPNRNRVLGILKALRVKIRNTVLRISEISPSKDGRHIELDALRVDPLTDDRTNKPYIINTIRSSRYTFWNFFPRQLFAQFSKLANFYFLCVSILQMIPNLSTTGRYTTILPLLIFVGISMSKEGYDDLRRYRLDKEENNRTASVLRPTRSQPPTSREGGSEATRSWLDIKWQEIKVGDILKLERDQAVPADIALLHVNGRNGSAYIETMALDGETNLKSKQASPPLAKRCNTMNGLTTATARFVVEDPNIDLYTFEGKVSVGEEVMPLTNTEIIYRGSVLRNTHQAVGMVIYTGEECKIRMNANKNPRIKAPSLQAVVNKVVIVIVCFVIALSIFNTVAYEIWAENVEEKAWYLANAGVAFFPILASFIIMFNTMIPLSLYVSLEIVKLAQMFLMNDIDMYDEESNTPMEPRTSTINEELGQVSYIFSDKTGTLTNNSMRFRKISVAGTAWLHDVDLREEAAHATRKEKLLHKKRDKGKQVLSRKSNVSDMVQRGRKSNVSTLKDHGAAMIRSDSIFSNLNLGKPQNTHHGGKTEEMLEYILHKPHTVFARRVRFFILSIALCHTCIPENDDKGNISFQAASPDEAALVRAAQELGYLVVDRQANNLTIKTLPGGPGSEAVHETYQILDVIEFSSARKRMSVVVRMPDQRICIFCKGADSIVQKLLRLSGLAREKITEIERRSSKRKSMEAQQALRRVSEQRTRKDSGRKGSTSVPRPSIGGGSSMTRGRLPSIRDDLDSWLKERQSDGQVPPRDDNSIYYSPRPSLQLLSGRESLARSDGRSSSQNDHTDELVEEELVLNDAAVFERCFQHINDFATEGLRTLLYAYRYVGEAEYAVWRKSYHDATTSLVDRQYLIEKVGEQLERDFELTGATAIEDKLQKGVPEAIDKLRRANIKLWMLTGDKRETAINIGHSCRLVKDYSTVTILDHELGQVDRHMAAAMVNINSGTVAHSVIVIDGQTLSLIEAEQTVYELFIDLAILADSVICCRASPSQKASLVKSIRKKVKKSVTLAIGDGANDIAMIQEAHVGIGITGKEGLQAARTSDYSIAQFRFLLKLLLVHGRWNYIRTCKYTLGTFWKEMLFYLTQALYQRWAGYTGTSLYEPWSLSMFNTLFTSLPVIFMGIFEKDLAASTLLAVPELYTKGQRNGGFNIKIYLWWTFLAASDAMVVFFVMLGLYGQALFTRDNGLYAMGALTFTACVIIISTKMQALEMHNKSVTAVIAILLSVGGWFVWNLLLSTIYGNNTIYDVKRGLLDRFGQNALWWLTLILVVAAVVLFELGVSSMRAVIWPTDVDVFQEYEQDRGIRKRFEEAAAEELQLGWNRGTKKSSLELMREEAAEAQREAEVQEILDRPRTMEEGKAKGSAMAMAMREVANASVRRRHSGGLEQVEMEDMMSGAVAGNGKGNGNSDRSTSKDRKSLEIQELFSTGFGSVRKGHLK